MSSNTKFVRLHIFTATKIQTMVIWVVTPCSDVVEHQHLGGPATSLYIHDVTTQMTMT